MGIRADTIRINRSRQDGTRVRPSGDRAASEGVPSGGREGIPSGGERGSITFKATATAVD